jgi:uncharacterized protein (TIGR02246 family)
MQIHAKFLVALPIMATLGLGAAQDQRSSPASLPHAGGSLPAAAAEHDRDAQAIGGVLDAFVKSYNAQDATAVSALFTPDAEIEDENGDITSGRDAILARFSRFFAGNDSGTINLTSDSLRFLGTNLAIEDGTASIASGDGTSRRNRYSAIYTRQGDRWLQARIRDLPPEGVAPHERLLELAWLLGKWVNESDDAIVSTSCKWSDDGNFLLRDFDVKVEGRSALSGTQRIGWDSQRKQFRMWVFDTNGGFADGLISHDENAEGDRWVIKATGVRASGQSVSATNVITVLSKDRLRWETSDWTVDGVAMPDGERLYLVRPAPLPGK